MISSPPEWKDYKEAPIAGSWLKRWIKSRFRFVDYPFLLGYRGYGNHEKFLIQGHVFRGMALNKPKQKHSAWKNFIALIKMFLVRTVSGAEVEIRFNGYKYLTQTREDGFFELEIKDHGLAHGWHKVEMELKDQLVEGQETVDLKTEVLIQHKFEYGLISDIDDTFLVSHVTRIWSKLYILLTKNAQSRKPFKGVVSFYQKLNKGITSADNPFFYVSSSEWNLYNFLIDFCKFHSLPKGVLQLKEIKDEWKDFFKKGSFSNHNHKEVKIERILALHPEGRFILLGDNGQHDPYIYRSIAEKYPGRIKAVYIRGIKRSHRKKVDEVMGEIRDLGVHALQFRKSSMAAEDAENEGFIK